MHPDKTTLDLRLPGYPMTRGEFREALDLAHQGILRTGQGDGEALGALLDQIAGIAPERDPQLDAAARRAYKDQAKTGIPVTDVT